MNIVSDFIRWIKSMQHLIMNNSTGLIDELDECLRYVGGPGGALALTGVAAATAYYYATRPVPEKPLVPLDNQCPIEDGPEQIHVSKFYKEAKDGKFISCLSDDARTLYQTFRKGVIESNNGPCLGWRKNLHSPYEWMTFNEALLRAKNFGSGLIALGLRPGPSTFVGIYSQNRPEWILFEQGVYCYSMVVVPLYDTLGPDACAFIIHQAEITVVVVEDDKKVNSLLDKAPRNLRKLIAIKEVRPATMQRAKNQGIEIYTFDEVEKLGAAKGFPEVEPKPSDICTLCYTSGTTGNPKGVMLSHMNVVSGVAGVLLQLGPHKPRVGDVMISFLPLAHMLERCCENGVYYNGGAVGFYSGDIKELTNDLKALKPTLMPAVPRLLNRVYDKIYAEVARSSVKKVLLRMALNAKESEIKRGIIRKTSLWDKIVFRKIQEGFGGRLRLMVVGSAPLSSTVLTFCRAALGCLICEGYGQTECTAPITLTVQGDFVPGHVGPPVACNAIKLVDVPEMEYYASQQHGEICVKGSNVFIGYYKDPVRTAETIDEDGWHHTGDIGQWQPNGTLKVIDRKKHIFKLSQGEYIVPEKIENAYIRSQYVEQVFVHGESLKSCVVAVVVPDVEVIKSWAMENNIPGTLSVLCNNPDVKQLIMSDMIAWGKQFGLKSFEQVKDIYLHPDPFSMQNGLLTPTFKSRRPQIKNYFAPQLDDMYKHLD
ncbi:long-chain-fatty-acid--CoA ligase 1 isoform X1 [Wyeomyia smithii]|uniref:long-chain-fatty-acid--CoA ligase 1 isoform X1 n=1 Tax=Wyeomyia smithii TaxID=174621 RepID=UPI002467DD55|nr:long-chain-fatty-acid--CoA ligase 1 isoform X1 [Wyeomyia smithii]XP_055528400.1 long-chain-fatty-acid--CoA ligase 1 isoform X1 [Wyeomyia smithii]XP_055528401.1 long-chain-fatty-acid--CoA ligase 1 isoform X1 [Wyeomyia smithii]XP_055528402.1 long-chain-fatty-acid--CoA ligase 1 isoform X1 [Wyeomyia smithii]XP_055528404.1 long-chain-fatty-acid--CoA ligase 1 isoform X1 [Wyeomyia smithii]XP_055528405.1 long-chain-fatty-acid--CoA ligase 1 isoform X1 [Wyeomyia smithii]XP_055528406.1 long-chain-fat